MTNLILIATSVLVTNITPEIKAPVSVTYPVCNQPGCLVMHWPVTNYVTVVEGKTNIVKATRFRGVWKGKPIDLTIED